ncbi:hypothetical protein VTK73DRAFT_2805 [Phialemonium thermophilum]|uniref:Uncharacterized protein n=1 Tax=Phialemonium thermophilum TaxID=223376 RepID=A0ABR3VNX6_9PEZI
MSHWLTIKAILRLDRHRQQSGRSRPWLFVMYKLVVPTAEWASRLLASFPFLFFFFFCAVVVFVSCPTSLSHKRA